MRNKIEYVLGVALGILAFFLIVAWVYNMYTSGLEKDCRELGQSRQGDLVIDCKVRKTGKD